MKSPTIAQTFGVVSAYDGHRAGGKGRVICDSTWHHFVNVNLIGVLEGALFDEFFQRGRGRAAQHNGFLSSAAGLAALSKIKNYYTNIGVWISPPPRHDCFNRVGMVGDRLFRPDHRGDPHKPRQSRWSGSLHRR